MLEIFNRINKLSYNWISITKQELKNLNKLFKKTLNNSTYKILLPIIKRITLFIKCTNKYNLIKQLILENFKYYKKNRNNVIRTHDFLLPKQTRYHYVIFRKMSIFFFLKKAGFEPTMRTLNRFTICRFKPLSHLFFFSSNFFLRHPLYE